MSRKNRRSESGFTLVEIMIVVSIIGLLAVIAIPSFAKARRKSQLTVCLDNLGTYQDALDVYAFEYIGYPANLDELVLRGFLDELPECPTGTPYAWSSSGDQYHLVCSAQHTPTISHVCIHENQPPEAK